MCKCMCVYMHTYLQGDLKQIEEIQPTVMDIFPVVNQKNIPRFEVKWNWKCRICPIAMGRCSYMSLMTPSHGRLVTSLYNWIFKATGLIWAYFQSVLRVMGISPTTWVIFHWISRGVILQARFKQQKYGQWWYQSKGYVNRSIYNMYIYIGVLLMPAGGKPRQRFGRFWKHTYFIRNMHISRYVTGLGGWGC